MKKKAQEKLAAKANPVVEEAPVAVAASEPDAVATESEVPAVEATTEDVVVADTAAEATTEETPSA
jgi:small subunit ribosomal protein S16